MLLGVGISTITNCDPDSLFKPSVMTISPDPPVPNQSANFSLVFHYEGPNITSGNVVTKLTIDGIPLPSVKTSLCDNMACPISSGNNTRDFQSNWPSFLTGRVEIQNNLIGEHGKALLCMDGKFQISQWITLYDLEMWSNGEGNYKWKKRAAQTFSHERKNAAFGSFWFYILCWI